MGGLSYWWKDEQGLWASDQWPSPYLHHLSSHSVCSLLWDGWFSSTQSCFPSWNANHPLHGALPGLEEFKVTFSFRLTDLETVLLKLKRPSVLLFVYWFIHSFIFWNHKITLMTQLGDSAHKLPEHCGILHTTDVHNTYPGSVTYFSIENLPQFSTYRTSQLGSKSAHCPWDPRWGLSITDHTAGLWLLDSTVCMFCVELKDAVLVTFLLLWLNPMAQSNLQKEEYIWLMAPEGFEFIMVGGMAAMGKHGSTGRKLTAQISTCKSEAEREPEVEQGHGILEPVLSGTRCSVKLDHLNLPKQHHQLGTNFPNTQF